MGLRRWATLAVLCVALPAAAAEPWSTEAWGGKFRYGAYSTLVSSAILGGDYQDLIAMLQEPTVNYQIVKGRIYDFQTYYDSLTDDQIKAIVADAKANKTPTIYEEKRSVVSNDGQAQAFIDGMKGHVADLAPVDNLINEDGTFRSAAFQFNTHRGLYNNAYGIPQNSLASVVNAYVTGIRSVEFDVLETKNFENVVAHDLVTNRLDGSFDKPPFYISRHSYAEISRVPENVLDPTAPAPKSDPTPVRRLMTTEAFINLVVTTMPEMTLYADARNEAPISLIRLLKHHPEWRSKVVIKIYPFELKGGATDLIARYAARYKITEDAARSEIVDLRPNVLLAVGGADAQSSLKVMKTGDGMAITDFFAMSARLPFSRAAAARNWDGKPVFNADELDQIDIRTLRLLNWTAGLAGITNVLVLQETSIPSLDAILKSPADPQHRADYNAMNQGERISAAAHDSFLWLLRGIDSGDLAFNVTTKPGQIASIKARLANAEMGLSDRYPDFTLAKRNPDGSVDPTTLKDYLYRMDGIVYQANDLGSLKTRSMTALLSRRAEIEGALGGRKVAYATTDLPDDLRMGFMGLLGQRGIPVDINYRPSAILKPGKTPADIARYNPPAWTGHLYGPRFETTTLKSSVDAVNALKSALAKNKDYVDQLNWAAANGTQVFDWQMRKDAGWTGWNTPAAAIQARATAVAAERTPQIAQQEANLARARADFQARYGMPVD